MTHDEMQKEVERKYPILPSDCRTTRLMKQMARNAYFEKLRKLQAERQENNGKLES
jgi:hypothetical protein